MIYIILIAVFKALADSIKPDQFDGSVFKKLKGSMFWDLRYAETKYHNWSIFVFPLVAICDAWHLANTLMLMSAFAGFYYFKIEFDNILLHLVFCFSIYFIFFEGVRWILMGKIRLK